MIDASEPTLYQRVETYIRHVVRHPELVEMVSPNTQHPRVRRLELLLAHSHTLMGHASSLRSHGQAGVAAFEEARAFRGAVSAFEEAVRHGALKIGPFEGFTVRAIEAQLATQEIELVRLFTEMVQRAFKAVSEAELIELVAQRDGKTYSAAVGAYAMVKNYFPQVAALALIVGASVLFIQHRAEGRAQGSIA